jgi:hypothetical protein
MLEYQRLSVAISFRCGLIVKPADIASLAAPRPASRQAGRGGNLTRQEKRPAPRAAGRKDRGQ